MDILIVSVSIVVVAVPEGLPLAVTLSLAYATVRMMKDNNLVRVLKACETVGNATTICSDKTGTLTENKMSVVAGTVGTDKSFDVALPTQVRVVMDNAEQSNISLFFNESSDELKDLLRDSVVLNSTAFEGLDEAGNKIFIGSKTETALLDMAKKNLGLDDVSTERENAKSREVQLFPFSSERKCMGVVYRMEVNGQSFQRLFVKGASELAFKQCTRVVEVSDLGVGSRVLSPADREVVAQTIEEYASHSLRTIALSYRDFHHPFWPSETKFEDVFKEMVYIGVLGIKDPLRKGVKEAVKKCGEAGVVVRMVTGDNVSTAKAIAIECGIYTDGIIMEGPVFRRLNGNQMNEVIPKLQVLARSSPDDKRILVKRLKRLHETVAVTGDGTNDAPALKAADVGFSMGIAGTEVAKAASSIILMDDNFASIVRAIAWGRCVNDAVKKFLQVHSTMTVLIQFQLTVSVTAVGFAFVSSVASRDESSALTAVQLLWVNLIQDTLAALALATDPPNEQVLERKPEPRGTSMISFNMWKMIFGQSIVQLAVIFFLNFGGSRVFPQWDKNQLNTVIFNTFVWLQIFNEINCRRLDNHINVFAGIPKNPFFIAIMVVMVSCQIIIIFVGGAAFSVTRLDWYQWVISMAFGVLALPGGAIVRLIPNQFIMKFIPDRILNPKTSEPAEDREVEDWHEAMETIHDDLVYFKRIRCARRLQGIGLKKHKLDEVETPTTRRSSLARGDPSPIHSPVDSNRHAKPYSVNTATTLVPGLVALSTALAPIAPYNHSLFSTSSANGTNESEGVEAESF